MEGIDWGIYGIAKNPIITQELISAIETQLNLALPETYLDLIKYSDEAAPEISTFSYANESTCISEFFEFSQKNQPYTVCWYLDPNRNLGLPDKFLPFARDAGDQLMCLDYNFTPPTVELFKPQSKERFFVADNFEDFVKLWR